jgi:hypothetical protein
MNTFTEHCLLTLIFQEPTNNTGFNSLEDNIKCIPNIIASMRLYSCNVKKSKKKITQKEIRNGFITPQTQHYEFLIQMPPLSLRNLQKIQWAIPHFSHQQSPLQHNAEEIIGNVLSIVQQSSHASIVRVTLMYQKKENTLACETQEKIAHQKK